MIWDSYALGGAVVAGEPFPVRAFRDALGPRVAALHGLDPQPVPLALLLHGALLAPADVTCCHSRMLFNIHEIYQ